MSEAVSAVGGASSLGFVDVADAGLVGMVTIRGDFDEVGFQSAITSVTGMAVPGKREMETSAVDKLLWMSPDELLLVCAYDEAAARVAALSTALQGRYHLVENVSDARAVFDVLGNGAAVREALAKLTPADLRTSQLPVGEVRRTRLAQVAAAIWFEDEDRASVVCFRSVGDYVFNLLRQASAPGSEVGHF